MSKGSRVLAAACATAILLTHPAAAAGAPVGSSAGRTTHPTGVPARTSLTFIEALSAVPEATKALGVARRQLQQARVREGTVLSVAQAARVTLDAATVAEYVTRSALARAEIAANATQDVIDDAARTMYASGGSFPTLVDVVLTADSEAGLARSLVTREYLASVADAVVVDDGRADEERHRAAASVAAAVSVRESAARARAIAGIALTAATGDVDARREVVADARARVRTLMSLTRVDRSAEYGRIRTCGDTLTRLLSRTGFEGEDLREAWAIVMRESGGRADAVSDTGDLGLFQINTDTWKDEKWFDKKLLLKRKYNATVARQLSRSGRSWYSWGLDGHGRPNPGAYVKAGWDDDRITSHIVLPYIQWYARYPCRPAYEADVPAAPADAQSR